MWLLTTTGRQHLAQQLLDACAKTMTQPGVCFVDGGTYPGLQLPPNWTLVESENIGVGAAMNRFLAAHPNLPFYGWLADDFLPKTNGWDVALSTAAGNKYIAYCDDEWDRQGQVPSWITSAFAVGGDLVRAVGWFSAPGLRQAGIDSAWNFLGRKYNLMRYLQHITVEHIQYKNGKRPKDAVDNDASAEQHLWEHYVNREQSKTFAAVAAFL